MCGIVGFVAPKSSPEWRKRVLDRLLLAAKVRGADATGIGFVDPDSQKIKIVKAGEPSPQFVYQNKEYKEATANLPEVVIGHTRAATVFSDGGASNPKNDHPFYAKDIGVAMIHNGVLQDDEKWRATVGKKRGLKNACDTDVDSEVFLRAVETFMADEEKPELANMEDAIFDAAFNIAGGYCLAFIKEDSPNKLWLVRHTNPLAIAFLHKEQAIVFASTPEILKEGVTEDYILFDYFIEDKVPKMSVVDATKDSLVVIESDPEVIFKINAIDLDCGSSDYKHHKEAFTNQTVLDQVID